MRAASFVSRLESAEVEDWLSTPEVFAMATEGSAQALGWGGRLGRIAPGFKADLVFLDAGHVNYVPLNDPVNQVVHAEDGTAVRRVMVGGRVVVENGRVITVDMTRARAMAEAAVERLRAATAPARRAAESLEPALIGACRALAARPYSTERALYQGGRSSAA